MFKEVVFRAISHGKTSERTSLMFIIHFESSIIYYTVKCDLSQLIEVKIGVGVARLRGNFTFTTFTTAKVGPKGDPIFDDVVTWRRGGVAVAVNFVGVGGCFAPEATFRRMA